jgi:nondiscriminating aspartyl-tRNA synthetase
MKRILFEAENSLEGRERNCGAVHGMVHALRIFGDTKFMILRLPKTMLQCVLPAELELPEGFGDGAAVRAYGQMHEDERAPGGSELLVEKIEIISTPSEPMPVPIHKFKMGLSPETELDLRPITLRTARSRAMFRLQEGIVRGFRDALYASGFTEIHTPKLSAGSAEGGANMFRLPYFGKKAVLAQSPQLYKQMMVGVYERVFEVGPVFRAEKHNTPRHLNEYTSLDFEMGFVESYEDIMAMEQKVLLHIFRLLRDEYSAELSALGAVLPDISEGIPSIRFDDAKRLAAEKYKREIRDPFDLEPEEETLISRAILEDTGSELVFVTHYPSKKRPFYAMDDPADPRYTLSFDLLMRGMEVTTGGLRIHEYAAQVEKMRRKGLDPAEFEDYLMIHKHGMPPHGGLGLGLERLLMRITGEKNVRMCALFPRDVSRLRP